ncbi:Uncharacterised protein [Bordetella pertussis]|nr:Uncharacterised protein [Bordetella pertussis]
MPAGICNSCMRASTALRRCGRVQASTCASKWAARRRRSVKGASSAPISGRSRAQ